MHFRQGDLVLLKDTNAHGVVISVASESLFEADKKDILMSVLWHGVSSPRWVMGSALAKVSA
jgi:hypothetical protein